MTNFFQPSGRCTDRGAEASNEMLLALQEIWRKWIAAGANPAELAAIGHSVVEDLRTSAVLDFEDEEKARNELPGNVFMIDQGQDCNAEFVRYSDRVSVTITNDRGFDGDIIVAELPHVLVNALGIWLESAKGKRYAESLEIQVDGAFFTCDKDDGVYILQMKRSFAPDEQVWVTADNLDGLRNWLGATFG